jgi:hypothetical protein
MDSFARTDRYRPKGYDWETWLDGRKHTLVQGTEKERLAGKADFSIEIRHFQQMALGHARKKGIFLKTQVGGDSGTENIIEIKAIREN